MEYPFDYRLLQALLAVVEEGGFERAAKRLFMTQSAISQRIRLLEEQVGMGVLVRSRPPQPTEAGQKLLSHYKQVSHLEGALMATLGGDHRAGRVTVPIAVNADSLTTWLLKALAPILRDGRVFLDIAVADQDETLALLRAGQVLGCISSRAEPMQGCSSVYLGTMYYRCLASPAFQARWFADGFTTEAARSAPLVTFDRKDGLQARLLSSMGLMPGDYPTHYLPDALTFKSFCLEGLGYGYLPMLQAQSDFEAGNLVDLCPDKGVELKLYWHHWNLKTPLMSAIIEALVHQALY